MSAVDSCRRDPEVLKYAPRFIIVCDGGSWAAADMKTGEALEFPLKELPRHYDFFLPWAGLEKTVITLENPADVRAAEKMGKIFDSLKKDNPGLDSHAMNVFMARLLFCFFAEDSGIFEEERLFTDFIERATAPGKRSLTRGIWIGQTSIRIFSATCSRPAWRRTNAPAWGSITLPFPTS